MDFILAGNENQPSAKLEPDLRSRIMNGG